MDSTTGDNEYCAQNSILLCDCRDEKDGECFHADLDNAQKIVKLSLNEIAFALLIESHRIASTPLNDWIVGAIKTKYPNGWIERICSCFAGEMKKHIKQRLETSCPLQDIFVICKIIRYRLHDLIGYSGKERVDAHVKERFSLQVQGVEAARHMTFHGELITLTEVYSSILLFISILTFLKRGQEQVEDLKSIALRISETFQSELKCFHMLSMATLINTMLYRSLGEFEREFSEYLKFNRGSVGEMDDGVSPVKSPSLSFSEFCKSIQRVVNSQRCEKEKRPTKRPEVEQLFP